MPTVLVVDDRCCVRRGLRMRLMLEPDIVVVGEAESGPAALAQAAALRPDVVLMDLAMPGMDGLAATAALRALAPDSAVVVLSMQDDLATRARALAAGAVAFVTKRAGEAALLAAIRAAAGAQPGPASDPA